ncbi:hypothetical protein RFI_18336, partial [Reticulomyxa filosa]
MIGDIATHSLVQCKSFLQYMYRQLVQVYNFLYVKNEHVPKPKKKAIPLHEMIVYSLTKSSNWIACDMFISQAADNESKEREFNRDLTEATGKEEFFLVKEWKKADPPIVLLNQMPIGQT